MCELAGSSWIHRHSTSTQSFSRLGACQVRHRDSDSTLAINEHVLYCLK
ncbi:MAG: hypothetical protein IJP48_02835 [Synergistaceae bacterium]|nr:hypothetical protein [Synergistaceae bacterium]